MVREVVYILVTTFIAYQAQGFWLSAFKLATTEANYATRSWKSQEYECIKDGLYPDPLNCSQYIQCSNGHAYYMPCPSGLQFSAILERCESPCDAHCNLTYACQCGWPECTTTETNYVTRSWRSQEFECIKDGLYPDPLNCSQYIQCSNGHAYYMPCPSGLQFSATLERCESPCDAHCNLNYACRCGWPECTTTEPNYVTHSWRSQEFECIKDGLYTDPLNCSQYIQCSNGHAYYMACTSGLQFSATLERCESPCDAHCNLTYACRCGWPECNKSSESEIDCAKDGLYKHPDLCSSYIQCADGIRYVMMCPEYLQFNETTLQCEKPCDAKCDPAYACTCEWETCTSDICILPKKTGPCWGNMHRWFYDQRSSQCKQFIYSGCKGNENNFGSKEECERKCVRPRKLPTYEHSTEEFTCKEDGLFPYPGDCNFYILCDNSKALKKACPFGSHFNTRTGRCELPCDAYCDQSLACLCEWPSCKTSIQSVFDISKIDCTSRPEVGPCKSSIPRYYFNRKTRKCKMFYYGGCKGNGNNYFSEYQCLEQCLRIHE